ncbi:MAG: response regulator [Deltaproteobacteria bacterium]|jgi:CheY-like chemotaxis protein/DNA-binding XRE family transcriptional regulator|nr:response regulator [Deltaproteobacteria bacterium]
MEQNDLHIGRKIKELRKTKGLSLEQLGKLCRCSKSYMSRIENGKRRIDVERLKCLAKELGVTPDYFLGFNNIDELVQSVNKDTKIVHVPGPFSPELSSDSEGKIYELVLRFDDSGEGRNVKVAKIEKSVAMENDADISAVPSATRTSVETSDVSQKVLIVDDQHFIIEFIKDALDAYDIHVEVEYAYSCAEALKKFKENLTGNNSISLVLLDYVRIQGSGRDTLKEMLQMNPRIPIIVMTGYGNRDIRQDALDCGAFDFIEKPISLNEMIKSVQRALRLT